jgi:hypothetical protein
MTLKETVPETGVEPKEKAARNGVVVRRHTPFTPSDPDAPFFTLLKERLIYLRNRRWVQLSALALLLGLGVWGFFFVRSLLPRTPAQQLEIRSDTLQVHLHVRETLAKLELLRAMIATRREPALIGRYYTLMSEDLERTFERAPKEVRSQWNGLERDFRRLQEDISDGSEMTLVTLDAVKVRLQQFD